MSKKSLFAIG